MSKRPLYDRLSSVAPAPPPKAGVVVETIDDLDRILALPRRPPVICQRDPVTKRFPPATQALIEVMTARFARPKRLSCACRPRRIIAASGGLLTIFRVLPSILKPEPPLQTTVEAFVGDNRTTAEEIALGRQVAQLRPGEVLDVPSADGSFSGNPCIDSLNAVQAWTLYEAGIVGGIVGFKGVGSGKTVSGLLAPLVFPDCRLAVLVIEPKQRQHYRSHYLRLREHFRVPSIVFDDDVPGHTVPGTPPLHLLSYSVLSQTRNSDMLDVRSPDVLILDEAHRACGVSAINRRVKRYLTDKIRQREDALARGETVLMRAVRLLDWSGTLEEKDISDTHMLSTYALGTGSPLPLDPREMENYAMVFNPSRRPDRESLTAKRLQRAFGDGEVSSYDMDNLFVEPEKAIRRGFQKWRMETMGVISASAQSINAAIYFTERKAPKMPEAVKEALLKVRAEVSERPDGEILVEKVQQIATARNIACGFYSYWAFPKHPCSCPAVLPANGKRCPDCTLILDWYAKRKLYNKDLRSKLLDGAVYLDSPKNCWDAAQRFWQDPPYEGSLPKWQCETWPAWRDIEGKVEYEERVEWLDDYLAKDAAEWALENKGIVWFQSTAFGRRVSELSGLPYFNGGSGGEARLRAEKGDRSIICSIQAHGAGTDGLQYLFSDQLITEIPASNASQRGLEQVLGRLHREGQKADAVNTLWYGHTTEFKDAKRKAYEQAQFNEQMLGLTQKLLYADMTDDD